MTHCGLYCGLCAQGVRIPSQAKALRESMTKEGWPYWAQEIPKFKKFWEFLGGIAESEGRRGCRTNECGPPFCGIRKCAQAKGIDVCPFCEEFPCRRMLGLAKGYVNLLADGERMKEIGIDAENTSSGDTAVLS